MDDVEATSVRRAASNLAELLARQVEHRPDLIAVVQPGAQRRTLTWSELDSQVSAVASGLAAHGLVAGHRIALLGPNGIEFVVAYFAALRCGFVVVPINPQSTPHEVRAMLLDSGARVLLGTAEVELEGLISGSKKSCELKPVSLLKPIGAENEHPGYASEHTGSDHLVDLLKGIERSSCAKNTMVVVTYDEFGGQWDHVPPPGQGSTTPGPSDAMGPGTRIPALVLAPGLHGNEVLDHASHDTTSIMATIEHRFGLAPVSSRDATVNDLSTVFTAHQVRGRK